MMASIVDHCLIPLIRFEWIKFEVIEYAWSLPLMTFSISFPIVLRRTIGRNVSDILYNSLLGFYYA